MQELFIPQHAMNLLNRRKETAATTKERKKKYGNETKILSVFLQSPTFISSFGQMLIPVAEKFFKYR